MPKPSDFWKGSPMLSPHNFAMPWRLRDRNSSSGTPSLLQRRGPRRHSLFRAGPGKDSPPKSASNLATFWSLCLFEKEIQTKRQEIAKAKLEAALNDIRVLLLVRSFESAQSVLKAVAELVVYADDGLVRQFDAFLEAARTGAAQRHAQQSVSDLESTQIVDRDDQTQSADLRQLEAMLGEVTGVAGHYPDDTEVQTAIEDIRTKSRRE